MPPLGANVPLAVPRVHPREVHRGRADGTIEQRFQTYLRPDLLLLDDSGRKGLRSAAPEELYDVINARNERGSIIFTRNRAPEEWPDLFGYPLLASASLDRLNHSAKVVVITGTSFRAQRAINPDTEVSIDP